MVSVTGRSRVPKPPASIATGNMVSRAAERRSSIAEPYASSDVVEDLLNAGPLASGCDEYHVVKAVRPGNGHQLIRFPLAPVRGRRIELRDQPCLPSHLNAALRYVGPLHPRVLLLKLAD